MDHGWRAGPRHDTFNSVWARPTRTSCCAWAVASVRSAVPDLHDYIIFILEKIIYTYV
jgi:hypothetical protein